MFIAGAVPALAQDETAPRTTIEIGETLTGTITTTNFEDVYTFQGSAGDLIIIRMEATKVFETYLFLATPDNEQLAYNDDFFGRNSLIIYRLPDDGTFQIIATRLGGRFGSGTGDYDLTLERVAASTTGVTQEGTFSSEQESDFFLFVPENTSDHTVTYRLSGGDFFPRLRINSFNESGGYLENIGYIEANGMLQASITLPMVADTVYVMQIEASYTGGSGNTPTVFTLVVDEAE
ncbi:MAG: hypothetical protein AAGK74_11250 [Chloroflexota bacterium]